MPKETTYLKLLEKDLQAFDIHMRQQAGNLIFSHGNRHIDFLPAGEDFDLSTTTSQLVLPLDYLISQRQKITAIIRSKLNLNTTVFARSCDIKKIDRQTAEQFLEQYHLMHATQSGFNYGLFFKDELMAVASFSKGRKMNRLTDDTRSFELIRFCCKAGITVTGGLTRLVKNFCRERQAGDIMTYVDKQLSDGRSFITAGFKKHSETPPNYFLADKITGERMAVKDKDIIFDEKKFYLACNSGNIKMIYTPDGKL